MTRRGISDLAALGSAALFACAAPDDAPRPPPVQGLDAAAPDAGARVDVDASDGAVGPIDAATEPDAIAPPPPCSALDVSGAPLVQMRTAPSPAPLPTGGGPLPDGAYDLVDAVEYDPPSYDAGPLPQVQQRFEVTAGGRYTRTTEVLPNGTATVVAAVRYDGTHLFTRAQCPPVSSEYSIGYSVEAGEIRFYAGVLGSRVFASVFRRVGGSP